MSESLLTQNLQLYRCQTWTQHRGDRLHDLQKYPPRQHCRFMHHLAVLDYATGGRPTPRCGTRPPGRKHLRSRGDRGVIRMAWHGRTRRHT